MKHLAGFLLIAFIAALLGGMGGCAGPNYQRGMKSYQPEDSAAALRQLKPLAAEGNADAQFNLGSLYHQGSGLPQDYQEAIKWFRKAADQGHAAARVNLGSLYAEGVQGVIPQDYPQALMWYIFAAASGDLEAMQLRDSLAAKMTPAQITEAQRLAREYKPEDAHAKALRELALLAEKGDAPAQLRLGVMYYHGQGVAVNYPEALKWFKQSALSGNPFAQSNVGYMYEKGEGTPQDFVEAAKWYRQAAERGNAQAQFSLGSMFEKGHGVMQDEVQALMWFNLAAARGEAKAKTARDRITVWMTPAQIAEAQRQAREFKMVGQ